MFFCETSNLRTERNRLFFPVEKKPDTLPASLLITFNQFLFQQLDKLVHQCCKYRDDK
jgi:hypothetical protein